MVARLVGQQHAGSTGGEIMDDGDSMHPKVSGHLIEIDITHQIYTHPMGSGEFGGCYLHKINPPLG